MRTHSELHHDLAAVNVQEVSRLSGVCAKTIYRIRQNSEYVPGLRIAERVDNAIDLIVARRSATAKA